MHRKSFASARREDLVIPTYRPGEPEKLPIFFEKRPYQGASGRIYPLPYTAGIGDVRKDVTYRAAILENEYLLLEVLPELGGKVQRALDKTTGYDFIYHNPVIKPAMVGLAGPWVSGGIEFNWPQHHRPTTFMPLECAITETNGEKTVWVGETDPLYRMRGMAGITIVPGRSYMKVKVRISNPTPFSQPVMWWANTAVAIHDGYRVVFPPDVETVNDHDRRAVLSWPIAKGVYRTARPFDFGEGTDLRRLSNIRVPSSYLVSKGQSSADFLAGYDEKADCGCVMTADHHIVPGKKLWHWGEHPFGAKWCANLTDDGSRYVELMTGAYTDNQPDFTWLAPYETRTFTQYWYPVREIGDVKEANEDAALNLERRGDELYIGVYATGVFENARILLQEGGRVLLDVRADVAPDRVFQTTLPAAGIDEEALTLSVFDAGNCRLVTYGAAKRGKKPELKPREPALPPEQIATCEELYLNGRHLEQYRHFSRDPEAYYREALRRDPGDARCNVAMARIALRRALFADALAYCDRALERLCLRNCNPEDTEAHYLRGVALRYLGRDEEAYDAFYEAAWGGRFAAAAYLALAELDAKCFGRLREAREKLEQSLSREANNVEALQLKYALTGFKAVRERIAELDPLYEDSPKKTSDRVDRALAYLRAGQIHRAVPLLEQADPKDAEALYYLAYLTGDRALAERADALSWGERFPSRTEDIAVLSRADTPKANYYLGCIYYDRERWDDAIAAWERAVAGNPGLAEAHRALALAYFDHKGEREKAIAAMERALALDPDSDRIFFEYQQLRKNTGASPEERLALHEAHAALSSRRDDCTLDHAVLLTQLGRYDEARDLLLAHRFHTYEGGEGNLTRHHAWLYTLRGLSCLDAGKPREALAEFEAGFTFPDCYGEENNWFAQEAHLHYGAWLAAKALGDTEKAEAHLCAATVDHAAPTEISFFRALALKAAGKPGEAEALLRELLSAGEELIREKDTLPYFGVGSPVPAPFEYDLSKFKENRGRLYAAFAALGLGDRETAARYAEAAAAADPHSFTLYLYRLLENREWGG